MNRRAALILTTMALLCLAVADGAPPCTPPMALRERGGATRWAGATKHKVY